MNKYPVYEKDRKVGEALLSAEGMFWRIRCICRPMFGRPEKICAQWDGGTMILGLCVPEGDHMTLLKRVAKNRMSETGLTFRILSCEEKELSISPDDPIADLAVLKYAKLVKRENGLYFSVSDRSSSKPTGQ